MEQARRLAFPVTPDGRYFVVRGRLWRCSHPELPAREREDLVQALMQARRAKGVAMRMGDAEAREAARATVDRIKVALGERGPVWWTDGAPDWNRRLVDRSPYRTWYQTELDAAGRERTDAVER